jgi:hypothetical protein
MGIQLPIEFPNYGPLIGRGVRCIDSSKETFFEKLFCPRQLVSHSLILLTPVICKGIQLRCNSLSVA